MKIVVTGGLGFIGRNFAQYMQQVAPGHTLHCVDWYARPDPFGTRSYTSVCRHDFAAQAARPVFEDADVVVHLAAMTTVQESIREPARCFTNNVTKTQVLLDHVRQVAPHAQIVFASTGGAIIGNHDGPIHEGVAPRPVSPYGASKLAVEGMLSAYTGAFGMPTTALRFSNVYGPNSERKTSVVATFCKAYLESGHLRINGDGQQTRDYVHVADICQAIWAAIRTRATGPFQLGTGVATSILELVEILKASTPKRRIKTTFATDLPGEVKHNVCDIAHAREVLGYQPRYDLTRGIADTLAWFQDAQASGHKAKAS